MSKVTITETFERGNRITGEYSIWNKSAEFEDFSADEVLKLISKSSTILSLPCSLDNRLIGISLLSGQKIKQLKEV